MSEHVHPVIVGLSARVPGQQGLSGMWTSLANGICTIGKVDPGLFNPELYYDSEPGQIGKSYSMFAGQLPDIHAFDHGFFGLSPRTSAQMDPQQKLMLRTTWEAIEDSGLSRCELAGERTGVFIGSSIVENLSLYYYDPARGDSQFMLGNTLSSIASRVSSIFDFRGPSHVLDTACASGLYALHQAAQALSRHEIDTAIVGGVHICRTPGGYVGFSQARMLSPRGLCSAFDAEADGYVRSEACIALVLQRPEIARAMGARPRAIVRASGLNTDGRSSRITIPSLAQQERLMSRVLDDSGIDPDDLAFYEAHGTGTAVGDPIEAGSLGAAIGVMRQQPLRIGSSKTNFGHSEPASGLVGVAKALLAFEHGLLPASLHFKNPSPHIDFEALNLAVNTAPHPLDRERPLFAGVNAFGFGGNNVCVLLEAAYPTAIAAAVPAAQPPAPPQSAETKWLLLSGSCENALKQSSLEWAHKLEHTARAEWGMLAAAQARRSEFTHRLGLPLGDEVATQLRQYAHARKAPNVIQGQSLGEARRILFAFPGNGVQTVQMGRREAQRSPLFRAHLDEVAAAFTAQGGPDIHALMADPELALRLSETIVAQSMLFAFQVAMARSLMETGLTPDLLLGHSAGEIAALHIAGALSLEESVRVVQWRAELLDQMRGHGSMAAVAAHEDQVARAIAEINDPALVIAAVNSPRSVTVSGPKAALERLAQIQIDGKRLPFVPVKVDIPYHSPLLDPLEGAFHAALGTIALAPPRIALASAVHGRMMRTAELNGSYFWRNTRAPVRFADALSTIAAKGPTTMVEIGPSHSLQANCRDLARAQGLALDYLGLETESLAESDDAPDLIEQLLVRAWCHGLSVPLEKLAGKLPSPRPALPAYPMQDSRHMAGLSADGLDAWSEVSHRHLVGLRADRASMTWSADFTPGFPEWLHEHQIGGRTLIPAVALVEMALGAARDLWRHKPLNLRDFDLVQALAVEGVGLRLRTEVEAQTGSVTISARERLSTNPWESAARGIIAPIPLASPPPPPLPPHAEPIDVSDIAARLRAAGMKHGARFQRLTALSAAPNGDLWAELGPARIEHISNLDFTALDASFHALAKLIDPNQQSARSQTLVPVRIGNLQLWRLGLEARHAHIRLTRQRSHSATADIVLLDADREVIAELQGVEFALMRLETRRDLPHTKVIRRELRHRLSGQNVRLPDAWQAPAQPLADIGWHGATAAPSTLACSIAKLRGQLGAGRSADDTLADLLAQAPALTLDLRTIMLEAAGRADPSLARNGWKHHALWRQAMRLITHLLDAWPQKERFSLRIEGLPDMAALTLLADRPDIDGLALAHPDPAQHEALWQLLPRHLRPALADPSEKTHALYDIIIDLTGSTRGALPATLAPHGLLIALDQPDLDGAIDDPLSPELIAHSANGLLPLRLRLWRKGVMEGEVKPSAPLRPLMLGAPHILPLKAAENDKSASHLILLHRASAEDDPAVLLRAMLGQLRQSLAHPRLPLVLICAAEGRSNRLFEVLTAGASSLIRSLNNEHPERRHGLLILRDPIATVSGDELAAWCEAALEKGHIDIREGCLFWPAFCPAPTLAESAPQTLTQLERGDLESLHWQPAGERPTLAPDEVELTVTASALNFRDVMLARGLLPERLLDLGNGGQGLGMECAGVITARGAEVEGLPVGTSVMGLVTSGFANRLVLRGSDVIALPERIELEDAAGLPVAYLTAWHALHSVARLNAGESVLIHGAAGGVGLAAIQIARAIGAQIHATASTPEKRAIARAYGAHHLYNSRDTAFAAQLKETTQGRGVDVVLNSLSGDAMRQSLGCLAPFGRFIELGKRDFLEGSTIELRPFLRNLSYHGVDLDQFVAQFPQAASDSLAKLREALSKGALKPLPTTIYPACEARQAFADMLSARHIGKILIAPPPLRQAHPTPTRPIKDAWVIIGGTGGIGLSLARRLLHEGAAAVHLISRSGQVALSSKAQAEWLKDEPRVHLHAVDARNAQSLARLFDEIEALGQSLGGVIHAAMELRDRMIRDADLIEQNRVISSKLGVALALDEALRCRAHQPENVIFLSSIVSRIANIGQASYAMANAALEALAAQRRAEGLAGLAIGWGPIRDAGHLQRDTLLAARINRIDGIGFSAVDALNTALIDAVRSGTQTDFTTAAIDWDRLVDILPTLEQPAFARLVARARPRQSDKIELIARLQSLSPKAAHALLCSEVTAILAAVLRMPASQIDIHRPIAEHGLDSLMAMELRMETERRFAHSFPLNLITRHVTPAHLATNLLESLRETSTATDTASPPDQESSS